jgi:hypothetical protein
MKYEIYENTNCPNGSGTWMIKVRTGGFDNQDDAVKFIITHLPEWKEYLIILTINSK